MNSKHSNPIALLVIYDPNFKFKNNKYYLKKGNNLIGSHQSCQIQIQDDNNNIKIPQKAANIHITQDLSTIQPLIQRTIYIPSNMHNKNALMVQLDVNVKYVIQMEKDFIICGRKTLMQVLSLNELLLIKGIINKDMFQINVNVNQQINDNQHLQINNGLFQPTQPLQSIYNDFQPTVPILDNYNQYEPTQLIQGYNQFSPTIPISDFDLIPQSYRRQQFNINKTSKEQQLPKITTIKQSSSISNSSQKQQNNIINQRQISMPDTIREQDEMAPTLYDDNQIKQTKSDMIVQVPQSMQDNHIFSPTIQQIKQQNHQYSSINKYMIKSSPIYRQIKKQNIYKKQTNCHYKQPNVKYFQSLQCLFQQTNSKQHRFHKHIQQSKNLSLEKQSVNNQNQQNLEVTSKQKGIISNNLKNINKIQKQKHQQPPPKELKKCYVIGKITKNQLQKLIKKSYTLITSQDDPNFPNIQLILIQGEVHATKTILLSLIKGIQFKPIAWLTNENIQLSGKLQGYLWTQILKRKGRGSTILDPTKTFYLQPQLRPQYQQVLQQAGGKLMLILTKNKSKMTVYFILDENSKEGHDIFKQWKKIKNFSFYSKKMVIQSILMGEEIIDKYRLDSYSF